MDTLLSELNKEFPTVHFKENVPLSELTSFRIGGPCKVLANIASAEEYASVSAFAKEHGIPFRLIGNGTNILAPDEGFDGILLKLAVSPSSIEFKDNRVKCDAGVSLAAVAHKAIKFGLMGMEALSGIPGSVGGACAMNAGAYGTEISDIIRNVTVLKNGTVETLSVCKNDFGYRRSPVCAPSAVVFAAEFELSPDDGYAAERLADYQLRRSTKQPLEFPSAGSVFKRPEGYFAGALIESSGLKGYRIGGACVSPKHAGFIVNDNRATADDVLNLISYVRLKVFERTGVMLEREVKLLSEV